MYFLLNCHCLFSLLVTILIFFLLLPAFNDDENNVGRILRVASKYERQLLPGKYHDEQQIVEVGVEFRVCVVFSYGDVFR